MQAKKYLITMLLLCLAFLLGGISFVMQMVENSEKETLTYLNNATLQINTTINKQIQGDFQTLEGIAVCFRYINSDNYEEFVNILRQINDGNSFIRMGLSDQNGKTTLLDIGGERRSNIDLSEKDFYQRVLKGENVISDTLKDRFTPNSYINYYCVPVYNDNHTLSTVLCAINSTTVLSNIIDQPLLNGKGYSNIIDSTGKLIVRATADEFSSTNAKTINEIGTISSDQLNMIQEALQQRKPLHFTFLFHGEKQVALIQPLGINDWSLFSLVPQSMLYERYQQTALGICILLFFAALLFVLLFGFQYRMMVKNQRELTKLAYFDALTGSSNYVKFLLDIQPLLDKRTDNHYAIWYCNIKKFKYFNDTFGYKKGDETLCQLSHLFQTHMQKEDLFCRVSADNFAGFRHYHHREEIALWYQDMLDEMNQSTQCSTLSPFQINLSMGIYLLEDYPEKIPPVDMVNRANMAQQYVKGRSGSQIAFFDDKTRQQIVMENELEADCRNALEQEEFKLYYQPKVDIQHGNVIIGAEVLARWLHPQKGLIPPGSFIPLFEKNGMIPTLDRYMFEHACQWQRHYLDSGNPPISLAINVSRFDLLSEDFIDYYTSVKKQYAIPDGLLELEFTESVLFENDALFLNLVHQLQAHGFICSLDDFGSGYSSLNILKNLTINVLKLDTVFFQRSIDQKREQIVITTIIEMAKKLEIQTIAEGVESTELVEFLRNAGCNMIQGFVFAKPMPQEEFEHLLSHSKGRVLLPLK